MEPEIAGTVDGVLQLQPLRNRLKGIVWVIKIEYSRRGLVMETHGTAFSLNSDGLVVTSAHLLPKGSNTIKARRLEEDEFNFVANVAYEKPRWDLALLQIIGVKDCQSGVLANNGSLSRHQTLLLIGHPHEFVGSFMAGKVAYDCVDDVKVPEGTLTCNNYRSTALRITPRYRVMGHVYDECAFEPAGGSSVRQISFEKNLHPYVPVIQMYGLIGGEGCSGGPVFNLGGEIVGILAMGAFGFEIAIHVSMLREILKLKEQNLGDKDEKRKETPDTSFKGGDSKKAKRDHAYQKDKGRVA